MFDYLQQFNKLPKDLRNKISQKEVMSKVSELEKKYQVDLAALVMKVMVKQIPYKNIALYLVGEKDLNEEKAEELSKKLKETVFKDVRDYLEGDKDKQEYSNKGIDASKSQVETKEANVREDKRDDPQELINQITKKEEHNIKIDTATQEIVEKADISLSSAYLHDRLHMVLRTYIKGVRDKVATRSVMSRSGQEGGLSLDDASIDKLLKLADEYKKSQEPEIEKPKTKVSEEAEKRDKLEALNESYNLKDSLKSKEQEEDKKKKEDTENSNEVKAENKNLEKKEDDKKDQENKEEYNKQENKNKEEKKEDLYKKLHIQREIAPPSPSTVVNKEKRESEKEIKEEDYHKQGSNNLEESKQKDLSTEGKSEDKQKELLEEESVDKKAEGENKKDEEKNKQESLESKDEEIKKQETKPKQVKENKKSFELNKETKPSSSSDLEDSAQETKKPASNNLSQAPVSAGKKSMQDIKVNQRIMGPVDELRYFNLKNFRRLSSDPQEAFAKIKEKIETLAKESYEKRIEGIQAWKENPLNKLYYQISRESLDQAKPISEVIKQRQENNMDTLSSEELKALVAFNRSYMF